MSALGCTSAVPQETASTVDTAAINTLHSSRVARNSDLPPPLPGTDPLALEPGGDLVSTGSTAGSLAGDRGLVLDILAPPTDDTEL